MIDPKELRIGNIVFKKDVLYKENGMDIFHRFYKINHNDIYNIVEYRDPTNHPVPLTAELLSKCGFIENPNYEHPAFDDLILSTNSRFGIGNFNGEYWVVDGVDQWFGDHRIDYLHQLQNLYFALTGTELKVDI